MSNNTVSDVWRVWLNAARHIKRGQQRGTTQITVTTSDYSDLLTVLAALKDAEEHK